MRKLFVFTFVSLDGYFEGPEHDISWFNADDYHFEAFQLEQSRETDVLLFGRKTYDLMESYWSTPYAVESDPAIAAFMNDCRKCVVTHTSFDPGWNNVTVISDDVIGTVQQLKTQPGRNIGILGSNQLCVNLMVAGLIDEFRIMVSPAVLGNGSSLFNGLSTREHLKLVDTQRFESGKVLLTYHPRPIAH